MIIFGTIIVIDFILGYILLYQKSLDSNILERNRNIFITIMTVMLIFISGCRSITTGTDTIRYVNNFFVIHHESLDLLIQNLYNYIRYQVKLKDPGYYILVKLITMITMNYHIFLFMIGSIVLIPLGMFIKHNSKEPIMSYLIFINVFFSFTLTGFRQSIAMSLGVFIGYEFIKRKKLISFILVVLIASTIHKSCFVLILFYFVCNSKFKINNATKILITIAVILSFVFKDTVFNYLVDVSDYDYTTYQGAGTYKFTTLLILIAIVAFWRSRIILTKNKNAIHYYYALTIALIFTPLSYINPSAIRVVFYFELFIMLLIPEIIQSFEGKEKTFVYYIASAVLLILFFATRPFYLFFWQ